MSLSIVLACGWFVLANVLAMIPSKKAHWPQAWGLIAVGIPILGFLAFEHGPWIGLLALAGAMSILRWPVIYLGRWMRGRVRR